MVNRLIIFAVLICLQTNINAQRFKSDWETFYVENWTVDISFDQEKYLDKTIQGKITLNHKTKTHLSLTYIVYLKNELDSSFNKKIMDWMTVQSCLNITNGTTNFMSFPFKNYYYLLQPCHNCNVGVDSDCEKLAIEILKFTNNDIGINGWKLYPLTIDKQGKFPYKLDIVGTITEVSPGIHCGVFCGCGTIRVKLQNPIPEYDGTDVFIALPCYGIDETGLNKTIHINVKQLTIDNDACFWNGGGLNRIDSKGYPFYIPADSNGWTLE